MSKGQTDEWTVHISDALPFRIIGGAGVKVTRGLTGQAATDNAVAGLLAAYRKPQRKSPPGVRIFGGGGQPTITVAAFDASNISQGKADLVCEGVNDDQTVQQAFDMLPTRGGKIVLTEGNFHFGSVGVILPSRDFHMHGMGRDATIVIADGAASYMFLDGVTSSQFREQQVSDMSFDGNSVGITSFLTISTLGSGNNVLVSNCYFHNFDSHGINMPRPVGGWAFEHCYFFANGGAGITCSETYLTVKDCIFLQNTGMGIDMTFTGGNHIMGNRFVDNGSHGVGIGNAVSGGAEQCIFSNNHFIDNTGYGLVVSHGGDHIIEGNLFDGNSSGSMAFGAGAFGVSVDSFITGNNQVGSGTFTTYAAGSSALESNNVVNGTLVP
jgi:parallel beta-helix repeat protein